jgi:tRNA uridine 5-carboxymethylaminomethyl modification enzyme
LTPIMSGLNCNTQFDVIVVGGGHSGCEAALASARLGCRTLLLTFSAKRVAALSCNPAFGGVAKGQLMREIDALGGECAKNADHAAIQWRMLNRGKGPAVYSPRAQVDCEAYPAQMLKVLLAESNLEVREEEAAGLLCEGKHILGVRSANGDELLAHSVILATGTFLGGVIHTGEETSQAGRIGDPSAMAMAESLRVLNIGLIRMKTGTPPRLRKSSVDFSGLEVQQGHEPTQRFSFRESPEIVNQAVCHITYTNANTHQIIADNLHRSPLFSGKIKGIGPRYCPSIEDKVKRFPDRSRHHVFLEPEKLGETRIYPNGLSTSLPIDVQKAYIQSIQGLEVAEILQPGYAVEYDCIDPTQLRHTMKLNGFEGLYMAGQINGTSGYEEAAGQGLIAGINAAFEVQNRAPFILSRHDSYLGVLIDDLVLRGVDEPYRMFTSRVDNRLEVRQDNADLRLMQLGYEIGLITNQEMKATQELQREVDAEHGRLCSLSVVPNEKTLELLEKTGSGRLKKPQRLGDLLKRPGVSYADLADFGLDNPASERVVEQVEIMFKYEGYAYRLKRDNNRNLQLEETRIPDDMKFHGIPSLSNEAADKLTRYRPETIGQASRIPGLTATDLASLTYRILNHKT